MALNGGLALGGVVGEEAGVWLVEVMGVEVRQNMPWLPLAGDGVVPDAAVGKGSGGEGTES